MVNITVKVKKWKVKKKIQGQKFQGQKFQNPKVQGHFQGHFRGQGQSQGNVFKICFRPFPALFNFSPIPTKILRKFLPQQTPLPPQVVGSEDSAGYVLKPVRHVPQ